MNAGYNKCARLLKKKSKTKIIKILLISYIWLGTKHSPFTHERMEIKCLLE